MPFFSKRGPSDADRVRQRHIESLLSTCPGAQASNPERTQYDIHIYLTDRTVTLRVFLPPEFPVMRPSIILMEPATHPLLDERGNVCNYSKLQNWNCHTDLGKLVQEIQDILLRSPPTFRQPPGQARSGGAGGYQPSQQTPYPPQSSFPGSAYPGSSGPQPSHAAYPGQNAYPGQSA
eukprot:Rmarinus@m.10733